MTRASCSYNHSRVARLSLSTKEGNGYEHVGRFHHPNADDDSTAAMADVSELDCGSFRMTSSNPVVTAEAVHLDHSEGNLPSLDLSSDAVAVPAMSLSLSEQQQEVPHPLLGRRRMSPIPQPCVPETVPEVIATPVGAAKTCCMYEEGKAEGGNTWNRPEFLSATVVRKSVDEKFGITFFVDNGKTKCKKRFLRLRGGKNKDRKQKRLPRISGLHDEGLLSQAPFSKGDLLVSINKQSCQGKSPTQLTEWLSNLTGTITLVVRNPGGDPSLVESFLLKPSRKSKTGINLNYSPRLNLLKVRQVHYGGLMVDGLLQVEDRVVGINHLPCHHWDAQAAADQIAESPWVSMVAQKHQHAGVVLTVQDDNPSEVDHTKTWYPATQSYDPRARLRIFPRAPSLPFSRSHDSRARLRLLPSRRQGLTREQSTDRLYLMTQSPISSAASF